MTDARVGAPLPDGQRVYRATGGDETVAGRRVVRRWEMADGTPLAVLWAGV